MKKLNRLVFLSLLVAVGLALSVLESAIPLPIPVPGAKLGLSNMVILVTIVIFGFRDGMTVAVLKSVLLMLVTGNVSSFVYSLSGGILSCMAMAISYTYASSIFSLIGVSIIGAVMHNVGQISVAVATMQNFRIFSYLPVLILLSLFTGYFVGLASSYISDNLKINIKKIVRE